MPNNKKPIYLIITGLIFAISILGVIVFYNYIKSQENNTSQRPTEQKDKFTEAMSKEYLTPEEAIQSYPWELESSQNKGLTFWPAGNSGSSEQNELYLKCCNIFNMEAPVIKKLDTDYTEVNNDTTKIYHISFKYSCTREVPLPLACKGQDFLYPELWAQAILKRQSNGKWKLTDIQHYSGL